MRIWLFAASVLALPCMADPLGANDYPALFAAHQDSVSTLDNGQRKLAISPSISIFETTRNGQTTYTGMDRSKGGALGCTIMLIANATSVLRKCPTMGTPIRDDQLSSLLTFYAANSLPPSNPETLRERFEGLVTSYSQDIPSCDIPDDIQRFVSAFSADKLDVTLNAATEKPRLPVSNPCL